MFRHFSTVCLASLFTSSALAATVPSGHTPPEQVTMFEKIKLTKAVGKVKGEGCEAAYKAAREDLDRVMGDKTDTVVAIWPLNGREGWKPVTEIECEDNGKKQVVKLEVLNLQQGEGPAYTQISGERVLEIIDAVIVDNGFMVGAQIGGIRTLDYNGELYYSAASIDRKEYISGNRNTRAVTAMREDLLSRMEYLSNMLAAVPEFHGIEVVVKNKHANKKGELQDEWFHYRLPTEAVQGFFGGTVSEQEMLDAGAVMYRSDARKAPVKIDISLVDVEE